jgi:hypothetical protein
MSVSADTAPATLPSAAAAPLPFMQLRRAGPESAGSSSAAAPVVAQEVAQRTSSAHRSSTSPAKEGAEELATSAPTRTDGRAQQTEACGVHCTLCSAAASMRWFCTEEVGGTCVGPAYVSDSSDAGGGCCVGDCSKCCRRRTAAQDSSMCWAAIQPRQSCVSAGIQCCRCRCRLRFDALARSSPQTVHWAGGRERGGADVASMLLLLRKTTTHCCCAAVVLPFHHTYAYSGQRSMSETSNTHVTRWDEEMCDERASRTDKHRCQ